MTYFRLLALTYCDVIPEAGRSAALPGAAMASVACVALQYGWNQATMRRLRHLAKLPEDENTAESGQPTFRQRMMGIFGVSQISEEEYIAKLKKTRDIYEKRIAFLEKLEAKAKEDDQKKDGEHEK
ncbi:hypothetical protein EST38_g3781 [Candolleomyces aberdarensis]|uniref:Uncharacterized protein n=1 Tax=Candolleomyces aberdarensis TaxID=2316362 RepID=A0A4Q2DP31_9AGAR|nr:hypothetical protein EST38_g3781 [Candolleomyces aberdarensis]